MSSLAKEYVNQIHQPTSDLLARSLRYGYINNCSYVNMLDSSYVL